MLAHCRVQFSKWKIVGLWVNSESTKIFNTQWFWNSKKLIFLLKNINQLNSALTLKSLNEITNVKLFFIHITLEVLLRLAAELIPEQIRFFWVTQNLVNESNDLLDLETSDTLNFGLIQIHYAVLKVELEKCFCATGWNLRYDKASEPCFMRPFKQESQISDIQSITVQKFR